MQHIVDTLTEALEYAQNASKTVTRDIYIIESKGVFYIEDKVPFIRLWETQHAVFTNGTRTS